MFLAFEDLNKTIISWIDWIKFDLMCIELPE